MTLKKTLSAVCAAALVATAAPAMAAKHFEIKVPVQFDMVPRQDVSDSKVYCEAHSSAEMSEATLIGQGRDNSNSLGGFSDPNKGTTNKITAYVKFDADADKDPRDATHYRCYIELTNKGQKCIPGVTENPPQWCTPAKETDTPVVTGAF